MLKPFPSTDEQTIPAQEIFREALGGTAGSLHRIFVPYRICPIGAHIDHQGGSVLGGTIPAGSVLLYTPLETPEVRLASRQFTEPVAFALGDPPQPDSWARYAQAAVLALMAQYSLSRGMAAAVSGTLLGAGLSSSASVGLAYLQALADTNGIALSKQDLLRLDLELERRYLGLDNGILDPSSILFGEGASLVYTDTRREQARPLPDPPGLESTGWLVVFSGVRRELTRGGGFNQRVAECRQAARWLDPAAAVLGDVPAPVFEDREAEMPETLRLRAAHYYGETARVEAGLAAWQAGDFEAFGDLMNQSCDSSIHNYQVAGEPLLTLQRIVQSRPGVYGSRFCGGGYGGCIAALVDRDRAAAAAGSLRAQYTRAFPEHASQAAVYWVPGGARP